MNNLKKYLGIMILVIFGGGLLVYAWRSLHGENLTEPPKFDLSVYTDTSWYDQSMRQVYDKYIQPVNEAIKVPNEQKISSGGAAAETGDLFIYFKRSFCDFAGAQALPSINNFLAKFPEMQGREVMLVSEPVEYCAKVDLAGVAKAAALKEQIQKDYSDLIVIK